MEPPPLRERLLRWYDDHRRDLPWRGSRDPWAIWVSEIMLQQTRVETVRAPYEAFMSRFPDPAALAAADDGELQAAWRGLGYYRRARLLRDGARAVVRDHDNRVPDDPNALGALPGIGRYTRGAVASIAFGHPEPAIDGNVERVAARHRGIEDNVKRSVGAKAVREFAVKHMDPQRAGDFNQALMELGATVCTPRAARCGQCPVSGDCIAWRDDRVEDLPVLPARRTAIPVDTALVAVAHGNGFLALTIPTGEPNAGQWELLGPGLLTNVDGPDALAEAVLDRSGLDVQIDGAIGKFSHGITHHRITVRVFCGQLRCDPDPSELHVASAHDPKAPWTTASRKAFKVLLGLTPP